MSFLTPLALIAGLLVIPIILLYMLRLRRREVMISSTFLWQQLLQDQEANTPWQRLRRNLLLFLQLLILLLMVLALARPFIEVPAVSAGQTALLIDASASMNATDIEGGETRFEAAQRAALEVVNTLGAENIMTVIRVGSIPEVLTPYTGDRERLRAAIDNAEPGNSQADWFAALTLAAAGGANIEDFTIVIVSDGGIAEANNFPDVSIPGEVEYVQVGESGENVAISALATRALPGQSPQLFAQLTNYSDTDAEVILTLRLDGESVPLDSERFTVPAASSLPIVSPQALPATFTSLQADLTLSVNSQTVDYLPTDNTAWTVSGDTGERSALLLTDGNIFLEQVLQSLPNLEVFRGEANRPLPSRPFDIYIFDGVVPDVLPNGDMLFINPPRSTALFTVGAENTQTANITVNNPNDPRLTYADFSAVSVLRFREISAPWADALVSADGGALLLAGETQGRQAAILPFNLRESDLPLQITFPILMSNLMEWFTPVTVLTPAQAYNVGDSVVIRPSLEADGVRVVLPTGETQDLTLDRETLIFTDTATPGVYRIEALAGGEVVQAQSVAVNLFAPLESNITPQSIQIGGETLTGEAREETGQQEFWHILLLLAMLVLLIEWYAYHRRLRMPTVLNPRGGKTASRHPLFSRG